jgi:hypothetical protein
MAKVFSADIMVCMTVYVVAETEEDACKQVQAFHGEGGEMRTGDEFISGLPVSEARYSDPDFPDISISPAVTVYAEDLTAYFVEEIEEEAEEEEETAE